MFFTQSKLHAGFAESNWRPIVIQTGEMFAVNSGSFVKSLLRFLVFEFMILRAMAAEEGFQWGVNGHPLTQSGYYDVALPDQLGLVQEMGAGWYRVDLSAGAFAASTARFDELLADAETDGIRILPVLSGSPGGRSETAAPEEIRTAAFAFARAVAGRYRGRITHWELGNELDAAALLRRGDRKRGGAFWQWGDPDGSEPGDYEEERYQRAKAEILGLGEGIKSADPRALTIVDTAGWLHYGFIERLVNEDRVPFDILAWHWYSEMGDIARVQGKLNLVDYLKRYGKPLWLTEINLRNGTAGGRDSDMAQFVAQSVATLGANPGIRALFIYELLDEPYFGENGESHYGLVEIARSSAGKWGVTRRKPAFDTFTAVIAAQAGAARPTR
jgi:hypothetical protein